MTPAAVRKRVVVVGGGPAGCEAARVAALRGHTVILCERGARLGGRINIAAALPDRDDYFAVSLFYTLELERLHVDVRLKTEATLDAVRALQPDAVVVATGTRPWLPDLPGIRAASVRQMEDVIEHVPDLGRRVVVLDYDHHVAPMAVADLLASRGHEVDLVTPLPMVGADVEINTQAVYYRRMAEHGVRLQTSLAPVSIEAGQVRLQHRFSREHAVLTDVDMVVICSPGAADDGLATALRSSGMQDVVVVGDAYAPRRLLAGIYDAYKAARRL